jgi:transposase
MRAASGPAPGRSQGREDGSAHAVDHGAHRKTAPPPAVPVRDQPGEWLRDEGFATASGARGRPEWSPSRLTLVTLLHQTENLTDRLTADAVRTKIDWKYLLGLSPDDLRPKTL